MWPSLVPWEMGNRVAQELASACPRRRVGVRLESSVSKYLLQGTAQAWGCRTGNMRSLKLSRCALTRHHLEVETGVDSQLNFLPVDEVRVERRGGRRGEGQPYRAGLAGGCP